MCTFLLVDLLWSIVGMKSLTNHASPSSTAMTLASAALHGADTEFNCSDTVGGVQLQGLAAGRHDVALIY